MFDLRSMFYAFRTAAPWLVLIVCIVALGLALALLPWKWAGLLVISSVVLLLIAIRPQCALCLLAFAVPFGSIREWPLGPVNISAAELIIALLLASWLARLFATRRILLPRAPLLLPLFLFLGAILLSTLGTSSLELSAKEIVKWLELTIIYLFMVDVVDGCWGQWVVWSLLAAGSAEALIGIYQFLRGVGPEGFILLGRFMRAYGHFAQPNPFAGYLGLTLPLAYALALNWRKGLVSRKELPVCGSLFASCFPLLVSYIVPVMSFAVMLAAMIMTWSRGGWVGLVAALTVITAARGRAALVSTVAIALLVTYLLLIGGAQYFPPTLVQRISDFMPYLSGIDVNRVEVTDANWAVVERMAHWLAAIGMFSDHPWLGVGIGNYPVVYSQYAVGRWRDPLGHAHNYYLNIAAEAGVVGVSAYLILFAACFVQAWRVSRRLSGSALKAISIRSPGQNEGHRPRTGELLYRAQNDMATAQNDIPFIPVERSYWRAVALGVLGVLVHLSVHNLFDNLFVHSMNVQLGLCLGLLAVAEKNTGGRDAYRY